MSLITLEEAKNYLRVDTSDDDGLIGVLLASACRLCADVARLSDEQWAVVDGGEDEASLYTEDELARIQEVMKVAVLYSLGYLYEHREEADHHGLTLTLRSLLFAIREGVF
ncbi:MAG: head-tail connector protein [Clostridiales bacterium]|nr:head-tail connector protein [Clostridiales bacterium]